MQSSSSWAEFVSLLLLCLLINIVPFKVVVLGLHTASPVILPLFTMYDDIVVICYLLGKSPASMLTYIETLQVHPTILITLW